MSSLLKREFYNVEWFVFFILFFVPTIYVLNMPIIYPAIFTLIFIMSGTFHTDEKFHVNRVIVSLPINKNLIIKAKYIFLVVALFIIVLYQWIIDFLAHFGLPYLDSAPLNGLTVILLFMGLCMILSLSLPFYYVFKTFRRAAVLHIISLFFLGFIVGLTFDNPFFEPFYLAFINLIDIQPFLIPMIISFVCLFLSYLFSFWLFLRRDIV